MMNRFETVMPQINFAMVGAMTIAVLAAIHGCQAGGDRVSAAQPTNVDPAMMPLQGAWQSAGGDTLLHITGRHCVTYADGQQSFTQIVQLPDGRFARTIFTSGMHMPGMLSRSDEGQLVVENAPCGESRTFTRLDTVPVQLRIDPFEPGSPRGS